MEYQPCVASGNKKMARAEAAIACLQELAALPANQIVVPRRQGLPPSTVATCTASRPVPCPPSQPPQPPKPVRPLMTVQPRPRFASLQSYRPSNPARPPPAPAEPPPPGVDFTSDVFEDLQKFDSTLLRISADRPPDSFAADNAFAEHECHTVGNDAEVGEPQSEKSLESCDAVGVPGDVPQELSADRGKRADGPEYDETSGGYNEFSGGGRPPWLEQRYSVVDAPAFFGGNRENVRPGTNTGFCEPRGQFCAEFSDFADDTFVNVGPGVLGEYCEDGTFVNEGPGILGEYYEGIDEPYDDVFRPREDVEPWAEDFQSDAFFQSPVGFGPRGTLPVRPLMRQPFRARGARPPRMPCPRPRIFQQFPRDPTPRRFLRPSFDTPSLRSPSPLPRGLFRPRMRSPIRPL